MTTTNARSSNISTGATTAVQKCPENVPDRLHLRDQPLRLRWWLHSNTKKVQLAFSDWNRCFQVLAMMSAIDVEWPNKIMLIFELMSAFKFDIDMLSECLFDIGFEVTFRSVALRNAVPCIGGLNILVHLCKVAFKSSSSTSGLAGPELARASAHGAVPLHVLLRLPVRCRPL